MKECRGDSRASTCFRVVYLSTMDVAEVSNGCGFPDGPNSSDDADVPDDAEGLDAPDGPNLREVPDAAKGLADLFEVNARSCADDPLKTLRSSRRPEPAKRPLSVYCQNVKRFQPPNRRGLGTR